ncbi:MAG: type II toxin-antitoxin system VapC family toxin [Verrucomicrobiia bacterium]
MTHILDTHVWIRAALGEPLPDPVQDRLRECARQLALADISLWEAAKLVELGRLRLCTPLSEFFRLALTPQLILLPITVAIADRVTSLEAAGFHKDPADQLIVATALVHGLRLITADRRIHQWKGVPLLWTEESG